MAGKFRVGMWVYVLRTRNLYRDQEAWVGRVFEVLEVFDAVNGAYLKSPADLEGTSNFFLFCELRPTVAEELIHDYRTEVQGG